VALLLELLCGGPAATNGRCRHNTCVCRAQGAGQVPHVCFVWSESKGSGITHVAVVATQTAASCTFHSSKVRPLKTHLPRRADAEVQLQPLTPCIHSRTLHWPQHPTLKAHRSTAHLVLVMQALQCTLSLQQAWLRAQLNRGCGHTRGRCGVVRRQAGRQAHRHVQVM
jgi:hypothetical protein